MAYRIRIPKSILQMQDTLRNLEGIDTRPLMRYAAEVSYNVSHQRFQTLWKLVEQRGFTIEQVVSHESKLCREGVPPKERDAILTNLHPCIDCGDPVYIKPDPNVTGEGGVNPYALCKDCWTPVGRLLKKIKRFFKRSN